MSRGRRRAARARRNRPPELKARAKALRAKLARVILHERMEAFRTAFGRPPSEEEIEFMRRRIAEPGGKRIDEFPPSARPVGETYPTPEDPA